MTVNKGRNRKVKLLDTSGKNQTVAVVVIKINRDRKNSSINRRNSNKGKRKVAVSGSKRY